MHIDIFADVVCPWCYIGAGRLQSALARRPDLQATRRWWPFQLQPEMPAEGLAWADFAEQKFGGEARAQAAFRQVESIGRAEGLAFDFSKVASAPNTVDAHRLILFAREHGAEWAVAEALYRAYFAEGADLNDLDQLAALAAAHGLDREATRAYLSSQGGTAEVWKSQDVAAHFGIQGVPFYLIDGQYGLSGAQPPEALLQAFDQIAAESAEAEPEG